MDKLTATRLLKITKKKHDTTKTSKKHSRFKLILFTKQSLSEFYHKMGSKSALGET